MRMLILVLLLSGPLWAQSPVINGDFETGAYTPKWTLTGGNTYTTMAKFNLPYGHNTWCLKRRPGSPSSNGGFEQQVFLVEGISYLFTADIAAQYCSS